MKKDRNRSQTAFATNCPNPFDLDNQEAYSVWRQWKLQQLPTGVKELTVGVSDLANPTPAELTAILDLCQRTNMAIYQSEPLLGEKAKDSIATFAAAFGLQHLDTHLHGDEDGITPLRVVGEEPHKTYIPYTNRSINWHTDGYYNEPGRQIGSLVLHCMATAASGGENALLDHEIAYIRLRDANPDYITALMHENAMTIPANRTGGREVRPDRSGPVFSVDSRHGTLHMRFTARAHNVVWRNDAVTRAAVDFLGKLFDSAEPGIFRHRLAPGEGLICNNVLHNRSAFEDDGQGTGRLLYRARFYDRINNTGLNPDMTWNEPMLSLSDLIIQHPEISSFEDLLAAVRKMAEDGERFLQFDVKPDYRDTPRNWEFQLESAFTWGEK